MIDRGGLVRWRSVVRSTLQGSGKKVPGTERRGLFCLFSFVLLSFVFFFFRSRGVATPQGFFVFLMKLSGRNRNGNKGDRALRGGSVRARKKV